MAELCVGDYQGSIFELTPPITAFRLHSDKKKEGEILLKQYLPKCFLRILAPTYVFGKKNMTLRPEKMDKCCILHLLWGSHHIH